MRNKYDVVIATDANYIIHALTLMTSVGVNEKETTCFHILSFNLSAQDKRRFDIIPFNFPQISFCFYDLSEIILRDALFSGVDVSRDRSLATYARLLIPELLPIDIHRCIYMDVDAIVCHSLRDFYDLELMDNLIAGVRDTNPLSRQRNVLMGGGINEYVYINAGMIVWNLDACRKYGAVDMFRYYIKDHKGNIDAMDQGTINGALHRHILPIHPRFNMLTSYFQMSSEEISLYYKVATYTESEINEARNNPLFVHFTPNLTTRPWMKNCKHPMAKNYWNYRNMISEDGKLEYDRRSIKHKILSTIFYFHHPLFFSLVKIAKYI